MRAREVPEVLFEEVAQKLGLKKHQIKVGSCAVWDLIFPVNFQAVIGHSEDEWQGQKHTKFHVWSFYFKPDFRPEDFASEIYNNEAVLRIVGGPFSQGIWVANQGQLLAENVKVKFGHRSNLKLDSPIIYLLSLIMHAAYTFICNKPVPELKYWEAFMNPNSDYTKPS